MEHIGRCKPLKQILQEAATEKLEKHFGLYSLLAIGVGGTIGSGIFVLSGTIAHTMAGPATCISWLVAGIVCMVTALSYAELSAAIPATGSAYIFAYHALGELFATLALWYVSLEYGVSGAAVSRSWGDKLAFWYGSLGFDDSCKTQQIGEPVSCWVNALGGTTINPAAFLVSTVATAILVRGGELGRVAINILVVLKILLVLFVIFTGIWYVNRENLIPFLPEPMEDPDSESSGFVGGTQGVLMGATSAFFGFIGFDEVTCLSGETVNARRVVPIAVISTILIVTILYMAASLTLTGMVKYTSISPEEGFGSAFKEVGCEWAMHITMIGQITVVLPTVVLVSYFPQSRLWYACAKDGMMPSVFARVEENGHIFWGTLICGALMTFIATFVPFDNLNEMISGGILLSFIITNCSLIMTRLNRINLASQSSDVNTDGTLIENTSIMGAKRLVFLYVFNSGLSAFGLRNFTETGIPFYGVLFAICGVLSFILIIALSKRFKLDRASKVFRVPFLPWTPCIGIFLNWYLFVELSILGALMVLALTIFACTSYFLFGIRYSTGRLTNNWTTERIVPNAGICSDFLKQENRSSICEFQNESDRDPLISLNETEMVRRRPSANKLGTEGESNGKLTVV